jgi:DNA-binding NtrC family response regulator
MKDKEISAYIVGDDDDDFELLSAAFDETDKSISICRFITCKELLDFIKQHANSVPSLIVLDMSTYWEENIECLRVIRKTERMDRVPVYLYTSIMYPVTHPGELKELDARFIHKPGMYPDIREIVNNMVNDIQREAGNNS